MSYKVKLENNAITVFEGANPFLSMKIGDLTPYSENCESYYNKVVLQANEVIHLGQLDLSILLAITAKRHPVLSSSLIIESPFLLSMECDKFPKLPIGQFGIFPFSEGINNVEFTNSSSFPIEIQILSVKTLTPPALPIATITTITPSMTSADKIVTIVGTNLQNTKEITINGLHCGFTVEDNNTVTLKVPECVGTFPILVSNGQKIVSKVVVVAENIPVISGMYPASDYGRATGIMTGDNIDKVKKISFGTYDIDFTIINNGSLSFTFPVLDSFTNYTGNLIIGLEDLREISGQPVTVLPYKSLQPVFTSINKYNVISGDVVTATGKYLDNIQELSLGGYYPGTLLTKTETTASFYFSPPSSYNASIVVQSLAGQQAYMDAYLSVRIPYIYGVYPRVIVPGDTIIISSDFFGEQTSSNSVSIDGIDCAIIFWTLSSVSIMVPNGITQGTLELHFNPRFSLPYTVELGSTNPPVITSTNVSFMTGDSVSLSGTSLGRVTHVTLDTEYISVVPGTDSSFYFYYGGNASTGSHALTVYTPYGQTSVIANISLPVTLSSYLSGSVSPGQTLVIHGTSLDKIIFLYLGNDNPLFTVSPDGTELSFVVPLNFYGYAGIYLYSNTGSYYDGAVYRY